MEFVETHAHLDSPQFDVDRDEVIERAVETGVSQMITVGADLGSSRAAVALAEAHAPIYATAGVHPHDAKQVTPDTLAALRTLAELECVVAVGEIGLDYYRNYAPHDVQRAVFEAQLALAGEVRKPVIVHIRDKPGASGAYEAALALLRPWVRQWPGDAARIGVLHCYSGDLATAQAAMEMGFFLGIDGPVTYPGAQALQSLVAELPLERLLLETDCPYLAPQARRGRRNEPAYIPFIAQQVAQLQGVPVAHVAEVTTANARRLFALPEKE